MQKILLCLVTSCASLCALSQTNTFPSSGNAGIGTTSPTVALDIQNLPAGGDVGFNISAYRSDTVYRNSFLTFGSPRFGSADGTTVGKRGYIVTPGTSNTTTASLFIGANTANAATTGNLSNIRSSNQSNIEISSDGMVDFWKSGTHYARINGSGASYLVGGNVGIGTSTPAYRLDVSGASAFAGGPANLDPTLSTPIPLSSLQNSGKLLIGWNRSAGKGEIDFIANEAGGTNGGYSFYRYSNNGVLTNLMLIDGTTGNVGIGTVNPQSLLAVNGTITAKQVTVSQLNWSDYVFEPFYRLLSLPAVENYIKENKHLPDVPSASDVAKSGIDLGTTQATLLRKIEELTLYAIEQEKQQKQMQSKIDAQNKTITAQQDLLQQQQRLLLQFRKDLNELKAGKK